VTHNHFRRGQGKEKEFGKAERPGGRQTKSSKGVRGIFTGKVLTNRGEDGQGPSQNDTRSRPVKVRGLCNKIPKSGEGPWVSLGKLQTASKRLGRDSPKACEVGIVSCGDPSQMIDPPQEGDKYSRKLATLRNGRGEKRYFHLRGEDAYGERWAGCPV